jgi:membrane protein DedA with SNARE-associated domain
VGEPAAPPSVAGGAPVAGAAARAILELVQAGFFGELLHDSRLVHVGLFLAALIDATGLPFPGRVLLITAGATAGHDWVQVAMLVAAGALGAAAGDHVWYVAGRLGAGDRLTALYCKLSLASDRCERRARDRYERFGPLAIVIGRFVAGVRILATPSTSQAIPYPRYLLFELAGALAWSAAFVGLGALLGTHWRALLARHGVGTILMAAVAVTIAGAGAIVAVRLIRVKRHGPALHGSPPSASTEPIWPAGQQR